MGRHRWVRRNKEKNGEDREGRKEIERDLRKNLMGKLERSRSRPETMKKLHQKPGRGAWTKRPPPTLHKPSNQITDLDLRLERRGRRRVYSTFFLFRERQDFLSLEN